MRQMVVLWWLVGLLVAVCGGPVRGGALPPNVFDANLGDERSSLSIRLLEVPYYYGETVILEATVRNTDSKAAFLPKPEALLVNGGGAPDIWRGITTLQHACMGPGGVLVDHSTGRHISRNRTNCLRRLAEMSVKLAPGEARTGVWVSSCLNGDEFAEGGIVREPPVPNPTPGVFGIRISCHDLLPDRWFRFRVRPFTEVNDTQLLTSPVGQEPREPTMFFSAPTGDGRYVLLGVGSWWRVGVGTAKPSPGDLNALARRWRFTRFGVLDKPAPTLILDVEGGLVAEGRPLIPRWYEFTSGGQEGWATRIRSSPETGRYRPKK